MLQMLELRTYRYGRKWWHISDFCNCYDSKFLHTH